jgi:hypothetical protein
VKPGLPLIKIIITENRMPLTKRYFIAEEEAKISMAQQLLVLKGLLVIEAL